MTTHQLSKPEIGYIGANEMAPEEYTANQSIADLDSTLTTNGYPAANVAKMTVNDKQYAVRLLGL